jgi:hypothetical protein
MPDHNAALAERAEIQRCTRTDVDVRCGFVQRRSVRRSDRRRPCRKKLSALLRVSLVVASNSPPSIETAPAPKAPVLPKTSTPPVTRTAPIVGETIAWQKSNFVL